MDHIDSICDKHGIKDYKINGDGSIDANQSINLTYNKLTELPLTFNKVDGDFQCHDNLLTTLKGSPVYVTGVFDCESNKLTSLEYSPTHVGETFTCSRNKLTTLMGAPSIVYGYFDCSHNKLSNLIGCPQMTITSDNIDELPFFGYNSFPNIVKNDLLDQNEGFTTSYYLQRIDAINTVIKYQEYYNIWENGFNKVNFIELMIEIEEGLR